MGRSRQMRKGIPKRAWRIHQKQKAKKRRNIKKGWRRYHRPCSYYCYYCIGMTGKEYRKKYKILLDQEQEDMLISMTDQDVVEVPTPEQILFEIQKEKEQKEIGWFEAVLPRINRST